MIMPGREAALGLAFALAGGIVASAEAATPAFPPWIKPGLTLHFVGYAAGRAGGRMQNPVVVSETIKVTALDNGRLYATSVVYPQGEQIEATTSNWSCDSAGTCQGNALQFWVDPQDPTGSIHGPNGEVYEVAGVGRFTDQWNRAWKATTLLYQNPANGVRFSITYETSSGLILEINQSYPNQIIESHYYNIQ
jgi:hypothetical protein